MAIDWSEGRWREMLVGQRRFLWREDSLELLARWIGLRPGMTVVDAGCGLGYLGYTFWRWFGDGGRYVGVDENAKLLADGAGIAGEWASGGTAAFARGSALDLPLADGSADRAMCQTLLMHLARPSRALAELVRVVRPGGLVVCIEPDNLAAWMSRILHRHADLGIEERLRMMRFQLVQHRGRKRLGRGDQSVGSRLPRLMREAGLRDLDVRLCDRVYHLEPPYRGELAEWLLEATRKELDASGPDEVPEGLREEIEAGGGKERDIEEILELTRRSNASIRERLERGELFSCGGGPLYVAIGRKATSRAAGRS